LGVTVGGGAAALRTAVLAALVRRAGLFAGFVDFAAGRGRALTAFLALAARPAGRVAAPVRLAFVRLAAFAGAFVRVRAGAALRRRVGAPPRRGVFDLAITESFRARPAGRGRRESTEVPSTLTGMS